MELCCQRTQASQARLYTTKDYSALESQAFLAQ